MTSATMADHKLISTPVSVSDGFKRGDGRTWLVLVAAGVAAVAIVVAINLFVEKSEPVRWPTAAPAAQPSDEPATDEPRTYDVAPPEALPQPPQGGRDER